MQTRHAAIGKDLDNVGVRPEKTGRWFTNSNEFQQWLKDPSCPYLCCYGERILPQDVGESDFC
jgi:hypothetical protein